MGADMKNLLALGAVAVLATACNAPKGPPAEAASAASPPSSAAGGGPHDPLTNGPKGPPEVAARDITIGSSLIAEASDLLDKDQICKSTYQKIKKDVRTAVKAEMAARAANGELQVDESAATDAHRKINQQYVDAFAPAYAPKPNPCPPPQP